MGFSVYSFVFIFQTSLTLFLFPFRKNFLIAVGRTFKTMLNKRGESEHLGLVPDLRGNAFRFSQLSMMLAVDLSYMAFFILR